MARHRVVPFDDPRFAKAPRSIRPSNPKYAAIQWRILETYVYTFLGYAGLGLLCALTIWGFGFSFSLSSILHIVGWGSIFWFGLPVLMWWYCAPLAIALQKAVPADPANVDHARVQACVDRVFADSGLKYKPPLYASPSDMPNAFATGPIHRKAVVAFTEGLLTIGLTDEEIEAVFAHELAHVKNYDVAINSLLSVLSMFFFLIVTAGIAGILGSLSFLSRLLGLTASARSSFLWGFLGKFIYIMLALPVYWLCSQLTRLVQVFVVRSRESAADATGSFMTGKPCALVGALKKLVDFAGKHRPKPGSEEFALYQVFRPIMTIDPLFDNGNPDPTPNGVWERIKALWIYMQLTHPPVPERIYHLERMNGGSCSTS